MDNIELLKSKAAILDLTEQNRELIKNFSKDVFVMGNLSVLEKYINKDKYVQHNVICKDGFEGLQAYILDMTRGGIVSYNKVHLIMADRDMVLVVGETTYKGYNISLHDIYRIESGKIVEHWNNAEILSDKETWQNNNGKFNYSRDPF